MAQPPQKPGTTQFLPVRKDQRFPPRYTPRNQPKVKGRGISALTLVKKVAKTQLLNSQYVSLRRVQIHKTKPLIKFETLTRMPGEKPRVHVQRIYAADPNWKGPLSQCPAIKIACTCGNYLFEWEVANAYRGASDIIYSNGNFPIETNPSLRPGVCKHVLKCLLFILQNNL